MHFNSHGVQNPTFLQVIKIMDFRSILTLLTISHAIPTVNNLENEAF